MRDSRSAALHSRCFETSARHSSSMGNTPSDTRAETRHPPRGPLKETVPPRGPHARPAHGPRPAAASTAPGVNGKGPHRSPRIALWYFNFGGRAESIRLALHVGGVPFEDVRISEEEFMKCKRDGKFPFGSVPVLEVDGVTYAQSVGILRYVGRLGGLYPEDPLIGLTIDQVVGAVEDLIVATVPFLFASEEEKMLMKHKLEKDVYPRFFSAFERLLKDHGEEYFVGPKLSVADLSVYPVLQWVTTSIVGPDSLKPYPLLSRLMQRVRSHPKVAEYYKLTEEAKSEQ